MTNKWLILEWHTSSFSSATEVSFIQVHNIFHKEVVNIFYIATNAWKYLYDSF